MHIPLLKAGCSPIRLVIRYLLNIFHSSNRYVRLDQVRGDIVIYAPLSLKCKRRI